MRAPWQTRQGPPTPTRRSEIERFSSPLFDARGFHFPCRLHRRRFVDFIKTIRLNAIYYRLSPAPPGYLESHFVGETAGGKDAHHLIPGKIAPAANHFLALHFHRAVD